MTSAVPQQLAPVQPLAGRVAPPRVLVVGRAPLTAEGIARVLERATGVVLAGVTCSMSVAVNMIAMRHPSMVVLDEQIDPSLCSVTRFASRHGVGVVLVLGPSGPPTVRASLGRRAGANAVVSSTVAPAELLDAIRHTAAGRPFVTPELRTGRPVRLAGLGGPGGALSPRESEVLHLIAEGMDNHGIAAALGVSLETVRTHVKNTARKLGARDRSQVVAMAYKSGFVDRFTR
ncbi:response regulator transcription factor [Kutzneria viridogrisea]|uniref:HTH luxR-type domain-containing protein n=2 Tax=Kutzneria TaxID=43356 RepID=W5WEM6_9PSEU|nr:response regulator transcription factor [Kutzneria albida]AHH99633.1 hypothetical protein KALB_6273 [Kutzneria albida DSM 43870]MBA8922811.1 DNA-binding NarL/FixJ family response regulator [Kutzneria viridogrisea]